MIGRPLTFRTTGVAPASPCTGRTTPGGVRAGDTAPIGPARSRAVPDTPCRAAADGRLDGSAARWTVRAVLTPAPTAEVARPSGSAEACVPVRVPVAEAPAVTRAGGRWARTARPGSPRRPTPPRPRRGRPSRGRGVRARTRRPGSYAAVCPGARARERVPAVATGAGASGVAEGVETAVWRGRIRDRATGSGKGVRPTGSGGVRRDVARAAPAGSTDRRVHETLVAPPGPVRPHQGRGRLSDSGAGRAGQAT